MACSVGGLVVIDLSGGNCVRVRQGCGLVLLCAVRDVSIMELLFNNLCVFVYTNGRVRDETEISPD